MENYIFDENNGLWYERRGDYYLPCLTISEEEQVPVGVWGQRHLRYIKEHNRALYMDLFWQGRLNRYLADIDAYAERMYSQLVEQMAEVDGIAEERKACDQMEWVRRMNAIRHAATEIICKEPIYV